MSLGSAELTAPFMAPGTAIRTRIRARFRYCLSLITVVCCLAGSDATGRPAWAGLPGVDLPGANQPGISQSRTRAPSAGQISARPPGGPSGPVTEAESSVDPLNACERAGVAMEQASGLPTGLLLAVGRVESGRWDDLRGRVTAWPWTINAAGKGLWFATKDAAARAARDLLNGGTRSVDVGCFQISLLWHPAAFASLEQAFDPDANAAYAARFLLALFSQTGSWEAAVEAYHSADPALGFAYRQQVFSTWDAAAAITVVPALRHRAASALAVASRPFAMPMVIAGVQIWTPMPLGTASGVVTMPGSPPPEQPNAPNSAAVPLPVVLYHAMPAGLLPAGLLPARVTRLRPHAARVVSAAAMPVR